MPASAEGGHCALIASLNCPFLNKCFSVQAVHSVANLIKQKSLELLNVSSIQHFWDSGMWSVNHPTAPTLPYPDPQSNKTVKSVKAKF